MSDVGPAGDDSTNTSPYSVVDPGNNYDVTNDESNDRDTILDQLRAENDRGNDDTAQSSSPKNDDDDAVQTDARPSHNAASEDDDITDEMIDRALATGMTASDLREFSNARELQRAVNVAERAMARAEQNKATNAEAAKQADTEKAPDFDKMLADGHDGDIVEAFRATWQQAQAAREQAQAVLRNEQQRQIEAQHRRFDDTLNSLAGYEAVFGKGQFSELTSKDPTQANNRQRVYTQMEIMRRGYQAMGQPVPDEAALIRSAAAATFPEQLVRTARQEIKGAIKNASRQAIARPNGGQQKAMSGSALAAQKEADFWKKFGE